MSARGRPGLPVEARRARVLAALGLVSLAVALTVVACVGLLVGLESLGVLILPGSLLTIVAVLVFPSTA